VVSHITTYPYCIPIVPSGCPQLLQLIQPCVESIAPLSGHCVWWPLLSCLLECAATSCGTEPSVSAAVTPSLCCVTSAADTALCQWTCYRLPGSSLQSVLHIAHLLQINLFLIGNCMCTSTNDIKCWWSSVICVVHVTWGEVRLTAGGSLSLSTSHSFLIWNEVAVWLCSSKQPWGCWGQNKCNFSCRCVWVWNMFCYMKE
jgi:hypothetical protein